MIRESQSPEEKPTVLLLTGVRSYRLPAFHRAAERLGIDALTGMHLPAELAGQWPDVIPLDFERIDDAVEQIVALAQERPVQAVMAVDDSGALLAAAAGERLGLPHNAPAAASAARDKYLMRQMLASSGLNTPAFRRFTTADDPVLIANEISFPAVVKPTNLNGSRGVMRVNDVPELVEAVERLRRIIAPEGSATTPFLVEDYIPGIELALEGMLDQGELRLLALFDKPDPLVGPFFEETIYVTPSRLTAGIRAEIAAVSQRAAQAIGLSTGPVHAEMRVNEAGVWIVEIAGRSIGGLCSDVLRFGVDESLEELILRQATGLPVAANQRESQASGVMMIPIPSSGILRQADGIEEAEAVPLIERVELSIPLGSPVRPLPEGDSYLGFIFARGTAPAAVEAALRTAHSLLRFTIDPIIDLRVA